MSAVRPDPDALLARVQREEAKAKRGKLKVFFGATAGVGKTYAMLEDARALKARGVDVVVGYVEPHGRAETEALLEGLERLPHRHVAYRGAALRDFDLDAALARKPRILLVDELAHSNPLEGEPRPRHAKRWQDVEELLEAGITVHTTVNVQHVESLNDIVAGITGVRMQETVPDSVFERADEVVMIDTPPDVLLERLQAGKVYIPEQARNAIENFFRKGNLIALRELALRTTVDAVGRGAQRQLAQRDEVALAEEILDRVARLLGDVHLARLQPLEQHVGRRVDHHHLVCALEYAVGDGFLHAHAGDPGDDVVQALDVLHVDRGVDGDAGLEQLLDVLPALGMPRPRLALEGVAVRELVDEQDLRLARERGVEVEVAQRGAAVSDVPVRQPLESLEQRLGLGAAVRLDVADDDVHASRLERARVFQHGVGLADARGRPEEHLQLAALRLRFLALHPGEQGIGVRAHGAHAATLVPFGPLLMRTAPQIVQCRGSNL